MTELVNTKCINNGKPFEAYKANILTGNRIEFIFVYRRGLEVGTVVSVRARFHGVHEPIVKEVTGNKRRADGLWDIFVMIRGDK